MKRFRVKFVADQNIVGTAVSGQEGRSDIAFLGCECVQAQKSDYRAMECKK